MAFLWTPRLDVLVVTLIAATTIACGTQAKPAGDAPKAAATAAATATATATAKPAGAVLKPNPDRAVSVDWLAGKLNDPAVVPVDLRTKEKYDAGHIPGAVLLASAAFSQKTGDVSDLAPAAQVAEALSKIGVKPTDAIVFYDDGGSLSATRALWGLDVYGHKDSRVLNGTWTSWEAAKKPVTKDVPTRASTQYAFSGAPNTSIVVTFDQMAKAVGDPSKIVCDSRTADEYTGRDLRAPAKSGGHVPGALNLAYNDAVAKTGEFLPVSELKKLYDNAGIKAQDNQTIFTYCQSGVRAAHAWFVLKYLIGYEKVAVYDGSWEEYGGRTDTKIESSRS